MLLRLLILVAVMELSDKFINKKVKISFSSTGMIFSLSSVRLVTAKNYSLFGVFLWC